MRKSRGAHGVLKLARCAVPLGASLLAAPREAVAMVSHYAAGAPNARDLFLPPSGLYIALYGRSEPALGRSATTRCARSEDGQSQP
jgi:hypothetical protein